jgi:GT2 family glycosyltransferase
VVSQSYHPREIIVVDNSADQPRTAAVAAQFPEVIYLKGDHCRPNPSVTRNLGIERSTGSFLAFIDDDSFVSDGWLQAVAEGLSTPGVGGVSGRVIETNIPAQKTENICRFQPDGALTGTFNSTTDQHIDIQYLHGCNHAIARAVIGLIGGYDPWLISYEDPDIGFRIREAGFRLLYVPQMVVEHQQAKRVNQIIRRDLIDVRSQFVSTRSLAYFINSHFGLNWGLLRTLFLQKPKAAVRAFLAEPEPARIAAVFATLAGALSGCMMAWARKARMHRLPKPVSL